MKTTAATIRKSLANYILHPRANRVLAFVPNSPEMRRAIKEWNRTRANKDIKLRPHGRGPSCLRAGWKGEYDVRLDKAPILAIYLVQKKVTRWVDQDCIGWNVIDPNLPAVVSPTIDFVKKV